VSEFLTDVGIVKNNDQEDLYYMCLRCIHILEYELTIFKSNVRGYYGYLLRLGGCFALDPAGFNEKSVFFTTTRYDHSRYSDNPFYNNDIIKWHESCLNRSRGRRYFSESAYSMIAKLLRDRLRLAVARLHRSGTTGRLEQTPGKMSGARECLAHRAWHGLPLRRPHATAPRLLPLGEALIVIVLLSIALWNGIWTLVALLASAP